MKYQDYKPTSKFLTLEQGENKIRLLTEAEQFTNVYNNIETTRFVAYAIDRKDGQIKPFTFGASIIGQIMQLARGTEYGFTTDTPPYDLIINRKGTEKATEYTVAPARKDTPLTKAETDALAELKPIAELAAKLDKKLVASEDHTKQTAPIEAYSDEGEISADQIPF